MSQIVNHYNFKIPAGFKPDKETLTRPKATFTIREILQRSMHGKNVQIDTRRVGHYGTQGNYLFKDRLQIVQEMEQVANQTDILIQQENQKAEEENQRKFNEAVEQKVKERADQQSVAKPPLDV